MSPFAGYSDNIKSTEDIMQDVLSSIYSHVKMCANEKAIEVSYDAADAKTYDSMNEKLYGRRRVTETSEIVSDHGNVNKTFSAILYKLFSFHNQNLSSPDYKLHFTPPSHNQIVCFLYPCKELNSKEETLEVFIFGYNTQGIIEFMSRAKVYQNKE